MFVHAGSIRYTSVNHVKHRAVTSNINGSGLSKLRPDDIVVVNEAYMTTDPAEIDR